MCSYMYAQENILSNLTHDTRNTCNTLTIMHTVTIVILTKLGIYLNIYCRQTPTESAMCAYMSEKCVKNRCNQVQVD